jgi:hypothetical protein
VSAARIYWGKKSPFFAVKGVIISVAVSRLAAI